MTIKQMIEQIRAGMAAKLAERKTHTDGISAVRAACAAETNRDPSEAEAEQVRAAQAAVSDIDAELEVMKARVSELEDEQRRDDAADRLAREVAVPGQTGSLPGNGTSVRVTSEPRTYSRETDPKGVGFLRDVARQVAFQDFGAGQRLARHMDEERVELDGKYLDRATGTGAFTGLVVPQYLVDLVAPNAKAGRPLADACRHHDLPAQGMTVNISKITTGSATGVQASEGTAATEQNMDDTLLSPAVQTNAGQQTVSRQAIERGAGIDDTTLEDLFRSYSTTLDNTLITQGTTGLSAVATAIAYTDATPTAAELYPKLLAGPSAVETALLDMDPGDTIAVMHSRRWYWIQSQLSNSWPLFGQPGATGVQNAGAVGVNRYGSGFRGLLPSGAPVIVDNNIATNSGAGTEDEIYFVAQSEAHLWEDPNAPMLIRAEQTFAANLQVLFVVYGYFAYTFTRRAHAQKIGGTGLIAPTF